MIRKLLAISFLLLIHGLAVNAQTRWYVKAGATGNGSSWANASGNLSGILNQAKANDEIWVANGTYLPVTCTACTLADRERSFTIAPGLKIYGSFNGTETSLTQRVLGDKTILSGDINNDGTPASNALTVVFFQSLCDVNTVLDGFTISGGNADLPGDPFGVYASGGGVFMDGKLTGLFCSPTLANCTIANNAALSYGGGVFALAGFGGKTNPVFNNCIFKNNTAGKQGGAFCAFTNTAIGGDIKLDHCTWLNNTSTENGGALEIFANEQPNTRVTLLNNIFNGNQSLRGEGGAIHLFSDRGKSKLILRDTEFNNNQAVRGGALFVESSFDEASARFCVERCKFIQNKTSSGGAAVYQNGSENGFFKAEYLDCIFVDNNANDSGGAVFSNAAHGHCQIDFRRCEFRSNVAKLYGAALYNLGEGGECSPLIESCLFWHNRASAAGAIYSLGARQGNASPRILNCTIVNNSANVGGGIYNQASDATGKCEPLIANTIIWGNHAGFAPVVQSGFAKPTFVHCIVDVADCKALESGTNNQSTCLQLQYLVNPRFVDTTSGNLHLLANSPAINAGTHQFWNLEEERLDLMRLRRISGIIDLGCYESEAQAPLAKPALSIGTNNIDLCSGQMLQIKPQYLPPCIDRFQWYKDGQALQGRTDSLLQIAAVAVANAGQYTLRAYGLDDQYWESPGRNVQVKNMLSPSAQITLPGQRWCEGDDLLLTASFNDAGAQPTLTWYRNNTLIPGATSTQLLLQDIQNNDRIRVRLKVIETCAAPDSALAEVILSPVLPLQQMTLRLDTLHLVNNCVDLQQDSTGFKISVTNGGPQPVIQWLVNGQVVKTGSTEFYLGGTSSIGKKIQASVTGTGCLVEATVKSKEHVVTCSTSAGSVPEYARYALYPNPAQNYCYLEGALPGEYALTNLQGAILRQGNLQAQQIHPLDCTQLLPGTYWVRITTAAGVQYLPLVVQ